ncbi:hypothetical protein R6Q59_014228 [Mikania micrantha]
MPSRQYTSPSPQPPPPDLHQFHLVPPFTVAFSFLIALIFCFRKCTTRKRTVPSDSKPPHKFSYAALRSATGSFSPSNRLGQGGFGSVYRGTLNNNLNVAVKVMDAGSLQGEREFQNELLFAGKIESDRILSVIGFTSDPRRRRMVLVYELMANGSLQDCLLHRKCLELKEWKKRLRLRLISLKVLKFYHYWTTDIHGDIKPSNILLNHNFNAKLGFCIQSPESFVTARIAETSPDTVTQSPRIGGGAGKDWWWKQDNGMSESGRVKDYVMEWIGSEINKERPKTEWIATGASSSAGQLLIRKEEIKNDWIGWISLDDDKNVKKQREGQLGNGGGRIL